MCSRRTITTLFTNRCYQVSSFHYNVHQPSRAAFLQCYEMDISPHATRVHAHASCSRIDACDLRRVGFTRYLLTSLSRFNCQAQTCSTLTFRRTARTALLSNKTIESRRRRGVHKPADQEQVLNCISLMRICGAPFECYGRDGSTVGLDIVLE